MGQEHDNQRQFIRLDFNKSFAFSVCAYELLTDLHLASSKNVSQTGICFTSVGTPKMDSIIKLSVDLSTLAECIQTEKYLFELDGGILAKVVWTKQSPEDPNMTDVGAAFIKLEEAGLPEVREAVTVLA